MSLTGRKLAIGYRDRVVGHELDIEFKSGEVLALLGPNGSGKTTLLKTLLGLIAPLGGDVEIDGRKMNALPARERARDDRLRSVIARSDLCIPGREYRAHGAHCARKPVQPADGT